MKKFFFLTFCFLIFSHCTDECKNDNVKLGDIGFSDNTSIFLEAYSTAESIQFESNNGTIKTFSIHEEDSGNPRLCIKVLCRPSFELDGMNGCEYYNVDDKYYTIRNEDLFLHLKAGIELYSPETDLMYDFVEIGLTEQFDSYFAGIITNSNFEEPTIDTSATVLNNQLTFFEQDTLGGFQNVWVYNNTIDDVYLIFDQLKGIKQYKYNDEIWTLIE